MNFREFATKNVMRNMRGYFGYFLSSTISAALLFSFTMLILHPNIDVTIFPEYLQIGLGLTTVIAYLFLCFFVFYSVSVFLKSRFKEFGILYILGISSKQIKKMIGIENILISYISGVSGVILGLVFSKIFLVVSGKLLGYKALQFYFPLKAMIITISAFVLMGIIISVFTSFIIKEDEVLSLLKGSKKPKIEPKSSSILSILSIGLLLVGYYASITSTKKNITYLIIPVTVVVIIATYFLFSQFSVFMIKILKKNRKFYMNKTAILWVSNLLYRIKDNTRIFFLITITSAVAFTSIAGVTAFWMNKESEVENNFPQAFFYESNKREIEIEEFIEGSLIRDGYEYRKINGEIKKVLLKGNTINVIDESTYNIIAKSFAREEIDVNENETVAAYILENAKRDSILIDNIEFNITKRLKEGVLPALYDNLFIVDDKVYENINGEIYLFYSFDVNNYKDTLNICKSYKEQFKSSQYDGKFIILMKANMLESIRIGYGVLMFLTIFIGLIFFVTTGSFLYNKCHMDIEEDKVKYKQLNKVGLTFKEIRKVLTIEIGVLFLFPYIVALIHSIFALSALKSSFGMDINIASFIVMSSFFIIQIIYFVIIRGSYLIEIKRCLLK